MRKSGSWSSLRAKGRGPARERMTKKWKWSRFSLFRRPQGSGVLFACAPALFLLRCKLAFCSAPTEPLVLQRAPLVAVAWSRSGGGRVFSRSLDHSRALSAVSGLSSDTTPQREGDASSHQKGIRRRCGTGGSQKEVKT